MPIENIQVERIEIPVVLLSKVIPIVYEGMVRCVPPQHLQKFYSDKRYVAKLQLTPTGIISVEIGY